MNKIKIKVFSVSPDVNSVTSLIGNFNSEKFPLTITCVKELSLISTDILIIQIDSIESKLIEQVAESKDEIKIPVMFIIPEGNSLIVSIIAKLGFNDLFIFPHELYKFNSYLKEVLEKHIALKNNHPSVTPESKHFDFSSLIGNSSDTKKVISIAKKIAKNSSLNSLILGETGTGKGALARAIHNFSNNHSPYVEVTCTAIPENLLESELFGYEKGAFTDAKTRKPGLFELAENGTIFLDEIGDLSLGLQAKLLRVIERKIIRRLGGVKDIPVNTRIISATNRNLQQLVENKQFRIDLYYRLKVITISLKPLRDRGDDILLLAEYFLKDYCRQYDRKLKKISDDLYSFMMHYNWPGNIREMKNAIETAVLLYDDSTLELEHFENLIQGSLEDKNNGFISPKNVRLDLNYEITRLEEVDKFYAKEVLNKVKGNKSKTARILGISRPKLDKLLNGSY